MGELSRSIGEEGERIALKFFETIGWKSLALNTTLSCLNPVNHKTGKSEKRSTHGVDLAFSYRSLTETNTIQHVIVSCKATETKYESPVGKFKEYIADLSQTMKCFSRSSVRSNWVKGFDNFNKQVDCGVLLWISLSEKNCSVIDRVASCNFPEESNFGVICLIDNNVINFHFDVVKFVRDKYPNFTYNYFVPHTALSISDINGDRKTTVLPVEYINSPFLWILLEHKMISNEKPILLLVTKDGFNSDAFGMYLAAARDLAQSITNRFAFCFYDYVDYRDAKTVDLVLQSILQDVDVSVFPIVPDFREGK